MNRLKIERYAMSLWGTNPWSDYCDHHWELTCRNKWDPGTSEIFTPPEIAAGMHFHARTWHQNYRGIFNCWWRSLLVAPSKFGLLTITRHSATRKHLFLYPRGARSCREESFEGKKKAPARHLSSNISHLFRGKLMPAL